MSQNKLCQVLSAPEIQSIRIYETMNHKPLSNDSLLAFPLHLLLTEHYILQV